MKRTFLFFALLFAILSCKDKQDDPAVEINDPNAKEPVSDTLSKEQLAFLDSLKSPAIAFDSLKLPNGMTVEEFRKYLDENKRVNGSLEFVSGPQLVKNRIILDMLTRAFELMDRKSFVKPDESTVANPYRPAQPNGIAYGYGLKDYSQRQNPPGQCYEEVYGLDCSGFVQQLATKAGLTSFPAGTDGQGNAASWNAIFEKDKQYKNLLVKDFGRIPISELQSGDIIVWAEHIGIIAGDGETSFVFNSSGSSANDCKDPDCIKKEQEKNRGTGRGPRWVPITDAHSATWFGSAFKILRITTVLSGKWQLLGRCDSRENDAIDFEIEIKPDPNRTGEIIPYTASSKGFDYDGSPYELAIKGEYDSRKNVLKGEMSFTFLNNPSGGRVDGFEFPLLNDDTGYYATTKIVDNAGCSINLRLINRSTEGGRIVSLMKNDVIRSNGPLLSGK